jgi:hypothetical protein
MKEYSNTGYFVTETGIIFGKYRDNAPLKQKTDRYGYKAVTLCVDGKAIHKTVHRLVAECFIENPNNLPQVNHIDHDKTNNNVNNLEWCDAAYNAAEKVRYGKQAKGSSIGNSCHTEDQVIMVCQMIQDVYRNCDIEKQTGVSRPAVNSIRNKKTWTHISDNYEFPKIAHQGVSMATFYWICEQLQAGKTYKEIRESYTGGEYIAYDCLKKIKRRKMRPEYSKGFIF